MPKTFIELFLLGGKDENRIMSIKPSFTMLKRSVKALDRLRPNIFVQFIWWPLPSLGVCKTDENCRAPNPYLLRDWALCSRSLICYHLSILSIRRRLHISILGTKKCEADQPQCRLDCRADDSMMSQPDLKVLWKIPTSLKTEEFQWNSLQDSSC